jgi:hypothetical protein
MIGVFITFRYGDNFDEKDVRKIADTARGRFEGMPALRSKAFTINSGKREAINFYVWDSADAAKAFFTDGLVELLRNARASGWVFTTLHAPTAVGPIN